MNFVCLFFFNNQKKLLQYFLFCFVLPSSPFSLHCGCTSTILSFEQPIDNLLFILWVPIHFVKSRRCRWLLNRSCGWSVCSKVSPFLKLKLSCFLNGVALWWCLFVIWLRLCRDIKYGGPSGPNNEYAPVNGHSLDSGLAAIILKI